MDKKTITLSFFMAIVSPSVYSAADNGSFYLGGKAGWSSYHNKGFQDPSLNVSNNEVSSNKAGYGGYVGFQAHPNVAFELGYDDLGKIKYKTQKPSQNEATYKVSGVHLTAKLSTAVSSNVDLYARVGTMSWQAKAKIKNNESIKHKGVSPVVAAGVEVAMTKGLAARLDYQWSENVGKKDKLKNRPDNGLLAVGVAYRFGQQEPFVESDPIDEVILPEEVIVAPQPVPPVDKEEVEVRGPIKITKKNKTVNLQTEVLFDFNKYTLNRHGREVLEQLILELAKFEILDKTVFLVGYSDRLGSDNYNMKLSEKRSEAVVNYLIEKGIPHDKISAVGKGKNNPVTLEDCDPELSRVKLIECLSLDRRVEIDVMGTLGV